MITTHHDTMNRLLRALWDRLLPPGGDVAVARSVDDDRETLSGFTIAPRRLAEERPRPSDLNRHGQCWWWPAMGRSWILCHSDNLEPGDTWLPYWAISDPSARP